MSQIELEALKPVGPVIGKIRAIAVTSTQGNTDLTSISEFGTGTDAARIFRLRADGNNIYFGFSNSSGATIDDTNTTQANATQCDVIPAGQFVDVCLPYKYNGTSAVCLYSFLYYKTATGLTATLRISVVSEDPGNRGAS